MDKRLLLVEPPFYRLYEAGMVLCNMPLGLGYLAGVVAARGDWRVRVLNADFDPAVTPAPTSHAVLAGEGYRRYRANLADPEAPIWRETLESIALEKPSVLGISVKSQNCASARLLARLAKRQNPDQFIVAGGPHPSMTGAEILTEPAIDAAVIGEGEETLTDLLDALATGRPLSGVPGLIFRQGGGIVSTGRRAPIADLDALPFPHAAAPEVLVDYARYPREAFGFVFATRGCPFDCQYCGSRYIWSRRPRLRSPGNVAAELAALAALGLKHVHFEDDTFGVGKPHLLALCKAIAGSGLTWSCELSVRLVDDEVMAAMRAAGCVAVLLGIESGNDAMLAHIRKGISVEQSRRASATVKRHGIRLLTFFMAGFALETEETLRDTFELMRTIGSDQIIYSVFTPYPGTESFEECKRLGLVDEGFDVSLYNHQSPSNCFCANIHRERFRELAGEMEAFVDAYNREHA
ncbi:B12-binding domain-containing radical SAM protein [Fundidesulfovibrio soli]|uniref:B12-binding domain-containing radical SAM protein n=1 Tax=Fundidesulfovibrio soli TaxID=2922716 RepID=UPI001FAFC2E4|nr:radical SAM protein [Fundidesulfovibrio soli]